MQRTEFVILPIYPMRRRIMFIRENAPAIVDGNDHQSPGKFISNYHNQSSKF